MFQPQRHYLFITSVTTLKCRVSTGNLDGKDLATMAFIGSQPVVAAVPGVHSQKFCLRSHRDWLPLLIVQTVLR